MREMPERFPERLQYLRERRGISRHTLSELCGLSKNMIACYERGEKQPTLSSLLLLADFFEISVGELIGDKKT